MEKVISKTPSNYPENAPRRYKVLYIQYSQWMVVFTVALMFILLPSVYTKEPVQGAISGKMFFFAYMVIFVGVQSFLPCSPIRLIFYP
ncbi:MAG: hypothetical protein LBG96_08555 [Tannerella sp.]|nr:hypothetical protein [Tannerella sp.]